MRRTCNSLGDSIWEWRCTVRLSERRWKKRVLDGSVSRRGFPAEQTPSVQRHFQPGALQRPAASARLSPLSVPCPRHISNLSTPAESPTFSTRHLNPPYRHCLALQRTIAHPSTCRGTPKPLPVLLEAFNFKRKELLLQYLKV